MSGQEDDVRELRPALQWYLWAIYLACAALLLGQLGPAVASGSLWHYPQVSLWELAVFGLLAYVAEHTMLHMGNSLSQSLTTAVHIALILLLPPPLALLIAFLAVLASKALPTHKPLYKRAFNICHATLTVGLTSLVFSLVAARTRVERPGHFLMDLPGFALVLAVYYLLDVGMLLVVLVLVERRPAWQVWRDTYYPILPPELAAGTIGILAGVVWRYDPALLALLVFPIAALRVALRAIAQAQESALVLRRRSEQLEAVLAAGQQLGLPRTPPQLLQPVVEAARAVVGSATAAAYLPDPADATRLTRVVLVPPDAGAVSPAYVPVDAARATTRDQGDAEGVLMAPLDVAGADVVGLLRLTGVPVDLGDGERDALSILATEAAIALQNARLYQTAQAAVRVRDDFLLAASHDLRTPLTGILGRAELMQMLLERPGPADAAGLRTQVDALCTAALRMTTVVEEITDAAHLQMGQQLGLQVGVVDVEALVRGAAEAVAIASPVGASTIDVTVPEQGLRLQGDRARLERVVQNIIANAVKYSPRATPVYVDVQAETEHVTITVRDRGVGIPRDELPHLFTRFYRASTARDVHGTGLGLAGAKDIVEQHGGFITVESVVDQGTTVSVVLPCVPLPPSGRNRVIPDDEAASVAGAAGSETSRLPASPVVSPIGTTPA
jgi:signal transduction histidine kinase